MQVCLGESKRERGNGRETFRLSGCAAEGNKKMQSFLVGKWHVLYLNPATYTYTF